MLDKELLSQRLLNTLSSTTALSQVLPISNEDKIQVFEIVQKFLQENGIKDIKTEELAYKYIKILSDLLRDMIKLWNPRLEAQIITDNKTSLAKSIADTKERKAKSTKAQIEQRIRKNIEQQGRKNQQDLSKYEQLMKTVHTITGKPLTELHLPEKELKEILAQNLMK